MYLVFGIYIYYLELIILQAVMFLQKYPCAFTYHIFWYSAASTSKIEDAGYAVKGRVCVNADNTGILLL